MSWVLGVDPGSAQSAFVVFDPKKQAIVEMGILSNDELLVMLRIYDPRIAVFAIETVASFGFSVGKEIFDTCIMVGRCIEAVRHHRYTVYPVTRKRVVVHHTGKSTGGDKEVRAAMIARFGNETGCKYDLWSSLAIASYVADRMQVTDT